MNHEYFQDKQKRILNSYNLEKGGEGSKGGHVIGHTKTNKPIYASHAGHSYGSYRSSDHDSAASIAREKGHEDLAKFHEDESKKVREFESKQGSASFNMYKDMSDSQLRAEYKKYESLRGKKNKTHDEWTLTDHIADLKFEIDHRGGFGNLKKSNENELIPMATTDILKARILSVYGVITTKQSDQIQKSNEDIIFGQESFTLDVDSLKPDLIKKAKDYEIKKSFELLESDLDLEKGMGRAGLHPQKITVHTKDGGTYQAIRWISSDSGKAASINGFKPEDEHTGTTAGDKINNIVTGVHSNKDKVKHLIGMGIYDRKHLANLVDDGYARQFTKQADLNPREFNDVELDENGEIKDAEAVLTSNDPRAGNKYKPEIDITMSMEDAEEALSTKDFEKYKKKLVESMREKFGITADKMWLSYERNIVRLVETGQPKSMLAYGTGGVGKTWTLEQVLDREKVRMYQTGLDMESDDYDAIKITGSTSKTGLWRKLFENRDKMLIFDDCDSLWDDPDCLNWLKGALDSSGDGTINYDQGDKVRLTRRANPDRGEDDEDDDPRAPREFQFTGKVIFISNLTSAQLVKKGAGPLVESRCLAIDLTMNLEQTMAKLKKIKDNMVIKDNKGNAVPGITKEDRDMAYNFMDEMKANVPVTKINGRTLGNLMGTAANLRRIGQLTPENFVDEALITFLS